MQVNDYMQGLAAKMVEKRGITDTSARKYIADLYRLNGNAPFKSLAWLKEEETIRGRLEPYAPSTRATILSAMVSAMSVNRAYKRYHDRWAKELFEGREAMDEAEKERKGAKTEREAANWVAWDDVVARREELAKDVEALPAGALTPKQWDLLQQYLLVCLYTMVPPRRNLDYLAMVTSRNGKMPDVTQNYWLPKDRKFVFNVYKTAKHHGAQEVEVPEELAKVLDLYMSRHPAGKGKGAAQARLLVKADGTAVTTANHITRALNRVFGRKVGSNLLRHAYLSSKYDVEAMEKDAEAMGHSVSEQREYLRK